MPNQFNPYMQPMPSFGPYQQGYGFNYAPQQPQQAPVTAKPLFDFVNGIEGAKSYQIGPGQTAFLFDNENSACYIKTANSMGLSTIEYFKVAKCSEQDIRGAAQANPQYATLEQFGSLESRLKAIEESLKAKEAK